MPRLITLASGQWADLPLEVLCKKLNEMGFDGVELACWGDHFDIDKAIESDAYIREKRALLEKYNLKVFAINAALSSQCICDDPIDSRHKNILPAHIWGDGDPEGVRQRAAEDLKKAAYAAKRFGVDVVIGFTGSSIWGKFYSFPPVSAEEIEAGYADFAKRFLPILDVYKKEGIRFALEVHPTEMAYDLVTTERTLKAINYHPSFCFNFDPSHLIHQMIDPVNFIDQFGDRIVHVHVKDARLQINGRNSILGSHLEFGDPRRGWEFTSPGRGDLKLDRMIRALNRVGYQGPLSIEWEDIGMDREWGARDALEFVRKNNFSPSTAAFDSAFSKK
ncbi:MAG: sugar phosphate isomerase/epimerase [Anaerolineae bacterium]|nr:sugar phosphate isomerase/epimerase [Anaerolineae bacterium]